MPDLKFEVTGAEPVARGITPILQFRVAITNQPETEIIRSVILHTQIQIQAPRRSYSPREKAGLIELFGPPEEWERTLSNRLWAVSHTSLPSFSGRAEAHLLTPCSYDLSLSANKYFYALEVGDIPLLFLFSGTVFYTAPNGSLQIQQISWNQEAAFQLPVTAWQQLMEQHYPNSVSLTLQRDVFNRLSFYKRAQGLASWDQAIERLLPAAEPHRLPA